MHPDAAFRMDEGAARAFVRDEGFGMLFATTPDGPRVAQVPVGVEGIVRPIDRAALREQVAAMTDTDETEPKGSVAGMDPRKAEGLFGAVPGLELVPTAWRGTAKVRDRVVRAPGDHEPGRWMRVP